jgi:hypothetical protein
MEHTISRLEYNKNHEDEIVSVFLAVNVTNGVDSTCFEHWLSGEEVSLVLKDEANLKPILTKCYAEAELKLENEVTTRPMPSIYPLQEEGKKAEIEALVTTKAIGTAKAVILEARAESVAKLEEPIEELPVEIIK